MSMRATKRASGVRGEEPTTSKRRRTEPEDALWQLRPVSDLKMSSIYNRGASEAPAELFRKDLISAMKVPDSEPLSSSEYWIITDTWKQDWERGVQVPVNPDSLPAPKVKVIDRVLPPDYQEFKLPKNKYIHLNRDAHYVAEQHLLSTTAARAEAACSYDLDATDSAWLKLLNAERARAGAHPVSEDQLEKVIQELEVRCWDKIQAIIKSEEGLGIEYDENVICDVCRSPDSEDGNEMVFCDSCNICVHQACYGITVIPPGQWLCRPCGDGVRPICVLCPNIGGAMKCTPSGHKWAHVSCVLWIPEVSIGCAEKMEPITKISAIPASRWSLVCVLCRERKGACIQCSVKTCKTAYHVTCAFKHGLEMRAIIEDENADDGVKLRSYCQKHSVNSKKDKGAGSGSEEEEVKRKRRKDMTSEEKNQARAARLQEIEREFDRHVSVKDISTHLLDVDQDAIYYIYNYWKLKRRAGHNRPLLPPKSDDSDLLSHRQEQADLDKMKMFVQLRQDLERVRNLCYMVSRREKLSRSFFRMREQTFHKQMAVISADNTISATDISAIIEANHGPSIYDKLYSHPDAADHKNDFDDLLARIAGPDSGEDKLDDVNGESKGKASNPYKKHYVNGSSRRSGSMYSGLSSEESASEIPRPNSRYKGRTIGSSTDEDTTKKKIVSPKKKISPKTKSKKSPKKTPTKKRTPQSKALIETSSDEETKAKQKQDIARSKTLQQMEKEMTAGEVHSGSESEEFIPIRTTKNNKFPVDIYSDSSDNEHTVKLEHGLNMDRSPNATNDSQQQLPRTKAAMKEFIPTQLSQNKDKSEEKVVKKRGRKPSQYKETKIVESEDDIKNKDEIKYSSSKDNPTDLIVPQRQAAKKASENMRSTTVATATTPTTPTTKPKEELVSDKIPSEDVTSPKQKIKTKKHPKEKEENVKENKKRKSSEDFDRETIAYVPQRQAAKKAAAHIKSGLGSKLPIVEPSDEKKKESEKQDNLKKSPKKDEDKCNQSPHKSSSSSSSNSSSSSYSSSSSSEEDDKPEAKPMVKAREIKPAANQSSLFSPPGPRPTVDLPFLDKVSRPLSSTSASSDSDSSKDSRVSGSGSPTPKRPRRRRKAKSISTDVSPRKAPDKKLKTSERRSVCRVPSPPAEGEEPGRPHGTRAATRARTRSTTAGGNMPNKCDARQRKPSRDDSFSSPESNKLAKETNKPSEFPTPERKADETVNKKKESIILNKVDDLEINLKTDENLSRNNNETHEKDKINNIDGNAKTPDQKHKIVSKRMSIKDVSIEQNRQLELKQRRISRRGSLDTSDINTKTSPSKKHIAEKPYETIDKKANSMTHGERFTETDKNWFPKAQSPNNQPPPIEKAGGHDKYMTEDKSLDSDSADKSSIKMIAKIQATLNENTMIKSPKTPLDARTLTDSMDAEHPLSRNIRKRSTVDSDKKFLTQDASHVQGVEISKSAKIPSTANQYSNRSMFSPQSKESELFVMDMLAVDDGFNHEEMMKPFPSYPDSFFFKEDSKEQGVQETLNLVDRLRLQLSSKKVPADNIIQDDSLCKSIDDDDSEQLHSEISPQNTDSVIDVVGQSPRSDTYKADNNLSNSTPVDLTPKEPKSNIPSACIEKWPDLPTPRIDTHNMQVSDDKFDQNLPYIDKDSVITQPDMHSVSEIDRDTVSKQSDDSQPISVVDHSIHSNDQESITQDNQTYDNNNSLIHSDCATISSPYVNPESKWQESKITQRRSSASSSGSEASVCSPNNEVKSHIHCDLRQSNVLQEMEPFPALPQYPCPIESTMPLNQYAPYASDSSPFLSSMGALPLFTQGVCPPGSMPLASPGAALFPPSLSFGNTPLLPPLSKSSFPTLCAAFTSSSQNIALTTAMIAPPTPKPTDSPRDEIDVTGSDKLSIHVASSPSADSCNDSCNRSTTHKLSNDNSNDTTISLESKSSVKPIKIASKFLSRSKSPGKSPRFSPKSVESSKSSITKRQNNKNNKSQRGKGRSKSRAQVFPPNVDYMGNSIQSKLVGTVYDFNEEMANDGVDLKSLRERRKSIDVHERRSDAPYKSSPQSPQVPSPNQNNMRKSQQVTESKIVKQTPPIVEPQSPTTSPLNATKNSSESGINLTTVVQPVLPGPVNMRTYQALDNSAPAVASGGQYHNQLMAFASCAADQHLADIDEEVEKQLHTALMGKPSTLSTPVVPEPAEPPAVATYTAQLPKVSLSDSRNQLKVKIKGPFLDANYAASSAQPVAPQPPPPALDTGPNILTASNASVSTMMTGTTNLRRMRKKELLRQYWTQDMNMDDPTNAASMGVPPAPAAPPPLSRAVITIPKAVASMTSIPTREDYKGISDSNTDKKKRKTTSGLSRELRHLEVSMNDDADVADDARLPNYASNSAQSYIHKRRGRVSAKPIKSNSPIAPKLKIKIGANFVQPLSNDDPSGFQFRPPKKRLASIQKPSIEDLRRESMKYRKMVMADFEEDEKVKKHKPNKSEKRKKKKDKKTDKLQVINSDSESATKLIIKIKRKKEEEVGERLSGAPSAGSGGARAAAAALAEPAVDPFEYDPSAPDPLAIDPPSYTEASSTMRKIRTAKLTPIRLKLSRSAEGSGYVMKGAGEEGEAPVAADSRGPAQPLPLPVSKHCEVR